MPSNNFENALSDWRKQLFLSKSTSVIRVEHISDLWPFEQSLQNWQSQFSVYLQALFDQDACNGALMDLDCWMRCRLAEYRQLKTANVDPAFKDVVQILQNLYETQLHATLNLLQTVQAVYENPDIIQQEGGKLELTLNEVNFYQYHQWVDQFQPGLLGKLTPQATTLTTNNQSEKENDSSTASASSLMLYISIWLTVTGVTSLFSFGLGVTCFTVGLLGLIFYVLFKRPILSLLMILFGISLQ